jgi:hypothetical protein
VVSALPRPSSFPNITSSLDPAEAKAEMSDSLFISDAMQQDTDYKSLDTAASQDVANVSQVTFPFRGVSPPREIPPFPSIIRWIPG